MDFSNFKVRCSAIDKVMSEPRDSMPITENQLKELSDLEAKDSLTDKQKIRMAELVAKRENSQKIALSDTCIEYLMECYAWLREGMLPVDKETMDLLQLKKGKLGEEDSITLLSEVLGRFYKKNSEPVFNDYLTGEPDVYEGNSIMEANEVDDLKTKWDYPGFLKSMHKKPEKCYERQLRGYADITGAKKIYLSKTLVTAPFEVIESVKWSFARKMNAITVESPEFLEEWEVIEKSMIFDHIPPQQRLYRVEVELFTQTERQRLYDKVKYCREWLNNFHETYIKLNS